MSGTASTATGPLTVAELVDVRRFCGYAPVPAPGSFDILGAALLPLLPEHLAVVRATYLTQLTVLENAIPATSAGLNVAQAAVFKRNMQEVADREALFRSWRLRLCRFLGVSSGPFMYEQLPGVFVV